MNAKLLVGGALLSATINYEAIGLKNGMFKSCPATENEEDQIESVEKDKERINNEQIKIFVCYHKQFPICKSDVLEPIHVGKENAKVDLGFIGDNTGDNISLKNLYFCELTATYWIWKNVKADIVGLYHYRRYFNFKNDHTKVNKIDKDFAEWSGNTLKEITSYFKEYDIILPKRSSCNRHIVSLYTEYEIHHIQSDLDIVFDIIYEKYPHQYQIAYNTLHTRRLGYYYNMLITKKEIFDAYAEWLFDILFELEKRIQRKVLKRDTYQQRVYGFLSELLINVFVALHPELKIKELPIIFVEEDKCEWIAYLLHYWTRRCFNLFNWRENHD